MTTKKRKFKCTGCGEDRPCFLETNQEPNPLDEMYDLFTEDLKCVLDSTNQTSYNWKEETEFGMSVKRQLTLTDVSNKEVALKSFVEEYVEAFEDGQGSDTALYRQAKSLL